jgi:hypothetical protein
MSASPAIVAEPSLLDEPEQRFPLDLDIRIPKIRSLLQQATKSQWDPRTDVDWDELDLTGVSDEHIWGARQYWSRRAWSEYGAISESPALQIRFCQQRIEPDLRLFFTIRTQEEARHAEACWLMAEKLGGYIDRPVVPAYSGAVATHGVRKMALDPEVPLEAIIAALVCAAEEIAIDVFKHLADITTNPVARTIQRLIMRDEVRHCAFGWHYMEHRVPRLSTGELAAVEKAVIVMIEKVELNGYHSAWLAPESEASKAEVKADRLTWEAGLGATVEELEKPIFIDTVRRVRERMAPWGITLPIFHHPKLGEF